MNKKVERDLKKIFQVFKGVGSLHAVWIFGSSVRKLEYKKTSDIDIMILLDDTNPKYGSKEMLRVESYQTAVLLEGAKKGYRIHFQKPQTLTNWWRLLFDGEPWAITSTIICQPLIDDKGFLERVTKLLSQHKPIRISQSERLLDRADQDMRTAKHIIEYELPKSLVTAYTEIIQSALAAKQIYTTTPVETLRAIHKDKVPVADTFGELIKDYLAGNLNLEKLDQYERNIEKFGLAALKLAKQWEKEYTEERLDEAYDKVIAALDKAFKKKNIKPVDYYKDFKKYFVDTEIIDEVHLRTLKDLQKHKKKSRLTDTEKSRYMNESYVKSYLIAFDEVFGDKK